MAANHAKRFANRPIFSLKIVAVGRPQNDVYMFDTGQSAQEVTHRTGDAKAKRRVYADGVTT